MRLTASAFALALAMTAARTPDTHSPVAHQQAPRSSRLGLRNDKAPEPVVIADTQRLVIRSLDGRSARQIPLIGESNRVPMWSPNGKLIAFQVSANGRNLIGVVQGDGTRPRVFPDAASATNQSLRWSPDSRFIGFLDPGRHEVRLLNVATGNIRTVSTDSVAQVGVWIWRPDGRSIAAVMTMPGALPGLRGLRRRVDEITLDGARRPLLNAAAMQGVPGVTFVDAFTIFARYDSAAYLMPLDGSPPHRLHDLVGSTGPSTGVHTTAPASRVWAGLIPGDLFEGGQIEFISVRTGERRVVDLPFRPFIGPSPEWTPDGRELVVAGWLPLDPASLDPTTVRLARAGDTTTVNQLFERSTATGRLYRVPVDGGAPQPIADFGETDGWTSVSPDGKFVVYGDRR